MPSHQPRRFYDSSWAGERVRELIEARPRGWKILAKMLDIETPALHRAAVRALQSSRLRWTRLKHMVKYLEGCDATMSSLLEADGQKYYTYVKRFCTESALDEMVSSAGHPRTGMHGL